jgi:hypothetical protein
MGTSGVSRQFRQITGLDDQPELEPEEAVVVEPELPLEEAVVVEPELPLEETPAEPEDASA